MRVYRHVYSICVYISGTIDSKDVDRLIWLLESGETIDTMHRVEPNEVYKHNAKLEWHIVQHSF